MQRTPVHTSRAPAAIGPYSQAIVAGGFCYLSGQIAMDPETGELVDGDIGAQVRQVFATWRRSPRRRAAISAVMP